MPKYVVCYKIQNKAQRLTSLLKENNNGYYSLSARMRESITIMEGDYSPLYAELDKIGSHIITSTYTVNSNLLSASDLVDYLIKKLPRALQNKIRIWAFEINSNNSHYPL